VGRLRRGFRAGLAVGSGVVWSGVVVVTDPTIPSDLVLGDHGAPLGEGLVVAGFWGGAGFAENFFVAMDLAVVVDAFSALFAGDAGGFVAGHLAGVEGDGDPLFAEEVFVGEFAVGEHLLLIFVSIWG